VADSLTGVRIFLAVAMVAACSSAKPPPPRPELIEVVRGLADQACECGTDKECLRAVRVEFDAVKVDLARHGLTGEPKESYDAELFRLRSCGDAGGVTIWL
jgi:hypothetical protein